MPQGNTRTTLYVAPAPPYAVSGNGAWVTDQTGHRVLDCNNNYTSLIHGHAHAGVLDAVRPVLETGTAFGLPTASEVDLAEHLAGRTGLPRWRFSNSGTEAVMTAVRAARAATGRSLIVRFDGSYHGTYDAVVSAGAAGVPGPVSELSIALPQGDRGAFEELMAHRGREVAAVLVDLMPNRAGLVPAQPDFVECVREATMRCGALLIVDEVISFRLRRGGLQSAYAVAPDLVTTGKVIGGGFPVGAVGGTTEVMSVFDPQVGHGVAWGGTFSANPVSMAAGLAALETFDGPAIQRLNELGDHLRTELTGRGVAATGSGSLVRLREDVDPTALWWELYHRGVLAGTNGLLALSTPMTTADAERVVQTVEASVAAVRAA
jgi:glutamate-1-semialdehyde 2,1-aminomutase